ncbi:MAG: c-type cytochrome biogenesis protein CcmI [Rhodospirillales bacterium]|nr:c-type cytochrome biogenesis protein CcmI [Rhodospirillales bacterium]
MMALWMMIVMLTAGIVAVLLVPMAFRRQAGAAPREDYDLNVYKDQLSEVDKDLERGLVSDAEAVAARTEIKRRMLAIIPSNQTDAAQEGGRGVMIGIGAVVLNGAKIGKNCIVGAKALITEGTEIPDNSLVVGAPGRVIKQVKPEGIADLTRIAEHYVTRWKKFKTEMIEDGE